MARKKKTRGKSLSAGALANKAAEKLQLLRRMEWADDNGYVQCCCCQEVRHYKDRMHGGHYIGRTRSATKLEHTNVNPQCAICNYKMSKGDTLVWENYRIFMIETYGEDELNRLKEKSKLTWKWCRTDLEEKIKELNGLIKQQEERLC